MPLKPGDCVEVTRPQPGFEHQAGETGTITHLAHGLVHIEDEDGHQSAYYPHELAHHPA